MAVNKVEYAGRTLIDLTGDTVTSSTLLAGRTAHAKDGTTIIGTLDMRTLTWDEWATLMGDEPWEDSA